MKGKEAGSEELGYVFCKLGYVFCGKLDPLFCCCVDVGNLLTY